MVYTNTVIVFTKVHTDDVIDVIPLEEITNIKVVDFQVDQLIENDPEVDGDINNKMMRLETRQDGYNSGHV